MNILQAINDKKLFAPWFKDRKTWANWRVFLAALFGLPMTPEQLAVFTQCTGRTEAPTEAANEAWLVCGRRAGKSFVLALIAVFLAAFKDYAPYLAPGERGTVLIIAADRRQARVIFRYVRAFLTKVPMLKRMIERETAEAFDLDNQVSIEIAVASFRSVRGYAIVAALCDEAAWWRTDDSAEPDYEVLDALRPGMATIPGAMLLCASSPYAKRGALHDAYRRHFGKNGRVLVWKAATREMNSTVPQHIIDAAMERDPASASAEWMAEFRSDLEEFVSRETVMACVEAGVRERSPRQGVTYYAFTDPSGGSSDSFSLSISHREGERVIIDAVREIRPPFSPEGVIDEYCTLLKTYRISRVRGDKYAGEFPREQFRKRNIGYVTAELSKSDLYRDLLPLLNSRSIVLPDNPRLINQLASLERRTARSGKDSIDHPPGAHDDLANAVAGAAALAARPVLVPVAQTGTYQLLRTYGSHR